MLTWYTVNVLFKKLISKIFPILVAPEIIIVSDNWTKLLGWVIVIWTHIILSISTKLAVIEFGKLLFLNGKNICG